MLVTMTCAVAYDFEGELVIPLGLRNDFSSYSASYMDEAISYDMRRLEASRITLCPWEGYYSSPYGW